MDPLTLALIAGGSTLAGNLPAIIPSRYEREQKKELEKLQRQQELGQLGLTDREQNALASQYGTVLAQQQARTDAEMRRMGGINAQPQNAILSAQAAAANEQALGADMAQQINMQDLAAIGQDEQLITDLKAAQGEYEQQRREAIVEPVAAAGMAYTQGQTLAALTGAGGAPMGATGSAMPKTAEQISLDVMLAQNTKTIPPQYQQAVANIVSEFGLTPDQAYAAFLNLEAANSPLASYYDMLGG
jgi:hypothetical protein